MLYCSVNGEVTDQISISNRALAYGDGVFTTAKVCNGEVIGLSDHISRLKDSSARLFIPAIDFVQLHKQLTNIVKDHALAVLKVVITAGQGGRGYSRVGVSDPTVIITLHDFPQHYFKWQKSGILAAQSKLKIGVNPLLAGIKHLNRLEQVLLRHELDDSAFDDLLVSDIEGNLVEATSGNVFWQQDGQWFTPDLTRSGVCGLQRAAILKVLPNSQIVRAKPTALENADAIFICNSVMGIVPIRSYNDRILAIDAVQAVQRLLQS